jgi:hypothetical protein
MTIRILGFILVCATAFAAEPTPSFYKEVLPVLQGNCQGCHRPGEVAPISFLTYESTRPWAKAIKEAVLTKKMPPWFADPHVGKFANDRSLSKSDIQTLVSWADSGAPAGDRKDAPAPIEFAEGWQIGKPDKILEMPARYDVPASGTIEYTYVVIPSGFPDNKWVYAAEARPGNRAVVHHLIAFVREPGSQWMRDAKPGVPYVPREGSAGIGDEFLAQFAPGEQPARLKQGQAVLVKAGSDIVLQLHYITNGKAQSDQSRVGLIFATGPVTERVGVLAVVDRNFAIPPGDPDYRVGASRTFARNTKILDIHPHMHFRGKAFSYRLVYPDGRTEDLLSVPRYDFNWQLVYELPGGKVVPAGTRMECVARYDNSANNKFNPDPTATVRWGDQTWEEMMVGFFRVSFDPGMNKADLMAPEPERPAQVTSSSVD